MEKWIEGDAPREYCEDCYQKDQDENDDDDEIEAVKIDETDTHLLVRADKEFDSDAMDNALYKDGLDWTFEKPKDGAKYSIIYIIDKEEEEKEETSVKN
tara:strand:- start:145 stop:441 length:297 start_codon:yes stop_codon:yes gene_type:complete